MKLSLLTLALIAGSLTSGAAMAASATGQVNVYHVNLDIGGGRTGCIQFAGAGLPNGWGCVYKTGAGASNLNITYINELLREAALNTKICQVFWNGLDGNGFAKISAAECAPRH